MQGMRPCVCGVRSWCLQTRETALVQGRVPSAQSSRSRLHGLRIVLRAPSPRSEGTAPAPLGVLGVFQGMSAFRWGAVGGLRDRLGPEEIADVAIMVPMRSR